MQCTCSSEARGDALSNAPLLSNWGFRLGMAAVLCTDGAPMWYLRPYSAAVPEAQQTRDQNLDMKELPLARGAK